MRFYRMLTSGTVALAAVALYMPSIEQRITMVAVWIMPISSVRADDPPTVAQWSGHPAIPRLTASVACAALRSPGRLIWAMPTSSPPSDAKSGAYGARAGMFATYGSAVVMNDPAAPSERSSFETVGDMPQFRTKRPPSARAHRGESA
jgi:hypothetical protein